MKYEGGYKEKVDTSIEAAIKNVSTAQSTAKGITIPSDFERAEELNNNVITGIENFSLNDIKDEIDSAIRAYEYIESLNKAFASNLKFDFGKTKGAALGIVEHTKAVIVKKELKDCVNQDTFYYKEWVDPENGKDGIVKNCLTEETKNDLEKLINSIDIKTIKNSGLDIETYVNNLKHAIAMSNKYVYKQELDLEELELELKKKDKDIKLEKTDKDIKLEHDNIIEHVDHVINAKTHVKDDGYLYTYKDGKEERLTREEWLKIVGQTAGEIYKNSSSQGGTNYYGNSGTPEAGQVQNAKTDGNDGNARNYGVDYASYVACDRLIAMSINNAGLYDDQNIGGENICRKKYLTEHGFDEVEDLTDIQPGDIIVVQGPGITHYFVINEYDKETGLCSKYDMGHNDRINTVQPYKDVPVVEEKWAEEGRELVAIYRLKE